MQENELLNPEELQSSKLAILPVDPTALVEEEIVMEGVEDVVETTEDDLNKKNYVKITPTFYIKSVELEEGEEEKLDEEGKVIELFKILNPETSVVETRELTVEEKHEVMVLQLKESKIKFQPVKHGAIKTVGTSTIISSIGRERKVKDKEIQTNVTTNQFGAAYHKKRQRRNKLAKASRKANR